MIFDHSSQRNLRSSADSKACELSIVMPCLNEALTVATCVRKAKTFLREHRVTGEVIVADNGSTDGSQKIASRAGAHVINVGAKGYGNALREGITAARGKYVIMGDADNSYDFSMLGPFLEKLREGYALVMGNRFMGGIEPGAMPALHRYLGNPVLSAIGRLLFRSTVGDFHCGLRGFDKAAIMRLRLSTTGMEFASEMVVKATLHKLKITEVPTTLFRDGRDRHPHLKSWSDGWRHLRLLLLHSPKWLFLYPGALMVVLGLAVKLWLLLGPRDFANITPNVHTLLYTAVATIIGFQAIIFYLLARAFTIDEGLHPPDSLIRKILRFVTLEAGLVIGSVLFIAGFTGTSFAIDIWKTTSFGHLAQSSAMWLAIISLTVLVLGIQFILSSFLLSILRLKIEAD